MKFNLSGFGYLTGVFLAVMFIVKLLKKMKRISLLETADPEQLISTMVHLLCLSSVLKRALNGAGLMPVLQSRIWLWRLKNWDSAVLS